MHLEELNAFFLKYILWVPPESKLNGETHTNTPTSNEQVRGLGL